MPNTFSIKCPDSRFPLIELKINNPVPTVEENVKQAEEINQGVQEILEQSPGKNFFVIADISELGVRGNYPSPQARQAYANLLRDDRIAKVAIIAPNLLLKSIIHFISAGSETEKIIIVNNRQEALDWFLKNEKL